MRKELYFEVFISFCFLFGKNFAVDGPRNELTRSPSSIQIPTLLNSKTIDSKKSFEVLSKIGPVEPNISEHSWLRLSQALGVRKWNNYEVLDVSWRSIVNYATKKGLGQYVTEIAGYNEAELFDRFNSELVTIQKSVEDPAFVDKVDKALREISKNLTGRHFFEKMLILKKLYEGQDSLVPLEPHFSIMYGEKSASSSEFGIVLLNTLSTEEKSILIGNSDTPFAPRLGSVLFHELTHSAHKFIGLSLFKGSKNLPGFLYAMLCDPSIAEKFDPFTNQLFYDEFSQRINELEHNDEREFQQLVLHSVSGASEWTKQYKEILKEAGYPANNDKVNIGKEIADILSAVFIRCLDNAEEALTICGSAPCYMLSYPCLITDDQNESMFLTRERNLVSLLHYPKDRGILEIFSCKNVRSILYEPMRKHGLLWTPMIDNSDENKKSEILFESEIAKKIEQKKKQEESQLRKEIPQRKEEEIKKETLYKFFAELGIRSRHPIPKELANQLVTNKKISKNVFECAVKTRWLEKLVDEIISKKIDVDISDVVSLMNDMLEQIEQPEISYNLIDNFLLLYKIAEDRGALENVKFSSNSLEKIIYSEKISACDLLKSEAIAFEKGVLRKILEFYKKRKDLLRISLTLNRMKQNNELTDIDITSNLYYIIDAFAYGIISLDDVFELAKAAKVDHLIVLRKLSDSSAEKYIQKILDNKLEINDSLFSYSIQNPYLREKENLMSRYWQQFWEKSHENLYFDILNALSMCKDPLFAEIGLKISNYSFDMEFAIFNEDSPYQHLNKEIFFLVLNGLLSNFEKIGQINGRNANYMFFKNQRFLGIYEFHENMEKFMRYATADHILMPDAVIMNVLKLEKICLEQPEIQHEYKYMRAKDHDIRTCFEYFNDLPKRSINLTNLLNSLKHDKNNLELIGNLVKYPAVVIDNPMEFLEFFDKAFPGHKLTSSLLKRCFEQNIPVTREILQRAITTHEEKLIKECLPNYFKNLEQNYSPEDMELFVSALDEIGDKREMFEKCNESGKLTNVLEKLKDPKRAYYESETRFFKSVEENYYIGLELLIDIAFNMLRQTEDEEIKNIIRKEAIEALEDPFADGWDVVFEEEDSDEKEKEEKFKTEEEMKKILEECIAAKDATKLKEYLNLDI